MKYVYSIAGSNGAEYEEATYEGCWRAGKREGQGTMTWAEGAYFTGKWKNDMREYGELRLQNGNFYRGPFMNDLPHGFGILLMTSGNIFKGEFTNGSCSSLGRLLYPNGNIYFG